MAPADMRGGHRSASALAKDKVKKKKKSFLHTREMKEFERSDLGSHWDGMNESIGWRVARVEPLLGSQKLEGGPEELPPAWISLHHLC